MIAGSISHPALPADRRGNHARVLDDLRPALPAEKTALGCVHLPAFSAAGCDPPTLEINRFSVRATRTGRESATLRQLSPSEP
jgi:hypothetical protein